jgi:hypothetical protein
MEQQAGTGQQGSGTTPETLAFRPAASPALGLAGREPKSP